MKPDNDIAAAALPRPYRVLGLKLKPLSLGHYLILRRHGCAFVSDDEKHATREDLIFAVLVCSMTFDEFQEWSESSLSVCGKVREVLRFACLRSSWMELKCALFGTKPQLDVMRWGRQAGFFDLQKKCELFLQYIREHTVEPKVWFERESKGESGGHWSHAVLVALTGQCGFTREEALAMPLHEALLHYYKAAENNGIVRLMRDDEIPEEENGSQSQS